MIGLSGGMIVPIWRTLAVRELGHVYSPFMSMVGGIPSLQYVTLNPWSGNWTSIFATYVVEGRKCGRSTRIPQSIGPEPGHSQDHAFFPPLYRTASSFGIRHF